MDGVSKSDVAAQTTVHMPAATGGLEEGSDLGQDVFVRADLEAAFDVFVRYGFKKTNMEDLASALGLSRQAVYKRYGNKQELFTRLVETMMAMGFADAYAELNRDDVHPIKRIINSVDALAGRYVDQLRSSPHGVEVIAMCDLEKRDMIESYEIDYHEARCALLIEHEVVENMQRARDVVHAFTFAAKGLLHTAPDHQAFKDGIQQTMRALLPDATDMLDGA